MGLDEAESDRQTKAGSRSDCLGSEERIEDSGKDSRGDPRAGIGERDLDAVFVSAEAFDHQGPASHKVEGVARIGDEIEADLRELDRIAPEARQRLIECQPEIDLVKAKLFGEEGGRTMNDRIEIHLLVFAGRFSGEVLEVSNDPRHPGGFPLDDLDLLSRLGAKIILLAQ